MNFVDYLSEVLLEGKIDDVLDKHTTIPHDVKQDYLKQVPANNAQHLDWVLQQHTKGNIKTEHNIHEILSTFNKVKDKLPKKQINQYKTVNDLHTAVLPHINNTKNTVNERSNSGTETLYNSPTMTIRQHHNYESAISGAVLPQNNRSGVNKASWCVSVGNGGGAAHHNQYTANGFHPVYTIEHQHPDGSSSKHMLVYDYNKTQAQQELRNEVDYRPGFNNSNDTRPDLLDHYGKEHSEIMKTPISHLFTEGGREEYKREAAPKQERLRATLRNIPSYGMSDEEYMSNFKAGQEKQQGGIHNKLAKVTLTPTQLNHLVEHGNEGSKHDIVVRNDLTDEHTQKLANTSNLLVHHLMLSQGKLSDSAFNTIVRKSHPAVIPYVIGHRKFNLTHIDHILNKNLNDANLTRIVYPYKDKLQPHHITQLIHKGDNATHKMIVGNLADSLLPSHINDLINKSTTDIHQNIINLMSNKLEPQHINALVNTNNANTQAHLVSKLYNKLEPQHVAYLQDKNDEEIKTAFERRVHDGLNSDQITNLLYKDNLDINNDVIDKIPNKLERKHIELLVDSKHNSIHRKLINNVADKLTSSDISELASKTDPHTQYTLMRQIPDRLESSHITRLIKNGDGNLHTSIIDMLPDQLNSGHISDLIDEAEPEVHNHIIDNMQNKLEPQHINEIIKSGDNDIRTKLLNQFSDRFNSDNITNMIKYSSGYTQSFAMRKLKNKLENHHIKTFIANQYPQDINISYHSLSPEFKKATIEHVQELKDKGDPRWSYYKNVHYDMNSPLKEWFNTTNAFQGLVKEGLINSNF